METCLVLEVSFGQVTPMALIFHSNLSYDTGCIDGFTRDMWVEKMAVAHCGEKDLSLHKGTWFRMLKCGVAQHWQEEAVPA